MADNPKVRAMYEALPFPARDPVKENPGSLPLSRTDILAKVNHHGFGGRRDLTRDFRVLVAGGGTGDSAIFLAAQLRDTDAEIVCLDLSANSLELARRRAALRGLEDRVRWVHGSLLDAPRLGLGRFDYVSCLGVLHHLPDPEAGLRALAEVLDDDGAMGLMVYGRYGRTDIYAMQDLMRLVDPGEADLPTQLADLKACMRALPPAHLLMRGRSREQLEAQLADDANLADTFLHAQDRAYTVPELHRFVEQAGLAIVNFTNFARTLRLEYEPESYLGGQALAARLAARTPKERHGIGELLHGHMYVHGFYAARPGRTPASFLDPDMVPFFLSVAGEEAARQLAERRVATVKLSSQLRLELAPSPAGLACLARIDGARPLSDIWSEVAGALALAVDDVAAAAAADLDRFNALNWVALRHRALPAPPMLAWPFRGDAAALVPVA
ncbi:class I SAM-dependent methyltransferase [Ramlibacter alkalitolerans]|uniref:Class I SAM-dependent methyltransferase n=1 Tax=Ramlibacter alkalitolerans TaxID=2039631 RepID=A0ABS1JR86_9BURK|nr:class I SAM-dependent methyltransferase [Ramlibacter alkalitolerans]MBL0426784.1 class I SAM-dependent methyltransferase [Ramlibacter alkalitolerans]